MKRTNTIRMTGASLKGNNGSGYRLSAAFSGRRFHDSTIYEVAWVGIQLDNSTAVSARRVKGWA